MLNVVYEIFNYLLHNYITLPLLMTRFHVKKMLCIKLTPLDVNDNDNICFFEEKKVIGIYLLA
jgi:hypothetical protein